MRKQQLVAPALVFIASLIVGVAQAEGPAGPPPGKAKHAEADPGKGEHGKPGLGKPGEAAAAAPGADKDKDKDGKDKDDKGKDKDKADKDHDNGHHGLRELLEDLKGGKLKKGDVKARLATLRDHRDERVKEHQSELKARFGAALALPAVHEELEHHARRMARLNRAMVLCETEVTKDKDKLKDRIQKLIDKEKERHERAMERFKSMPAAPGSAGAATSAAPAAPAAASAAVKAGDK